MKEIKDVSGDRFLKNISTIIIQCTVSLQKLVESLPMFYRVEKQKKLLINCKLFDNRIFYKHVFGMYTVKIIRIMLKHQSNESLLAVPKDFYSNHATQIYI